MTVTQPPLKRRPNALRSYGLIGDLITSFYDSTVLGLPHTPDDRPVGAGGPRIGLLQRLRSLPDVLLSSLTSSFVDKKAAATMLQHFQEVDARGHMAYFGNAL